MIRHHHSYFLAAMVVLCMLLGVAVVKENGTYAFAVVCVASLLFGLMGVAGLIEQKMDELKKLVEKVLG